MLRLSQALENSITVGGTGTERNHVEGPPKYSRMPDPSSDKKWAKNGWILSTLRIKVGHI